MSELHEHSKKNIVSEEGMKKLEERYLNLTTVRRAQIAEQISIARGFGDLSENAEYDEAKNEQSRLEAEILELENTIRTATVIGDDSINTDRVNIGTTVRVHDESEGTDEEYVIVGASESDPMVNVISNECPVGAALLGKRTGETAIVESPGGLIRLHILDIRKQ